MSDDIKCPVTGKTAAHISNADMNSKANSRLKPQVPCIQAIMGTVEAMTVNVTT